MDVAAPAFFPLFTGPSATIFSRLMTGWVLCTVRRTVCGMLPFADPDGHSAHDAYHRFFPDARWSLTDLWRTVTVLLVHTVCPTGTITMALDDTLFHRSGRKVNGAGWWRDAVRSTHSKIVYALGLNLVVLTIQVQPPWGGEPLGLPINMRLHRKGHTGLIDLAEAMIVEVTGWFPKRHFHMVADGFYAPLAGSDLTHAAIISRMQRNAELYDLPATPRKKQRGRPRKRGKRLPSPEKMVSHIRRWQKVEVRERGTVRTRLVYARKVLWYRVRKTPVLLVVSRDPAGKERDDFFVSTDVAMDPAEVIGTYADRWAIEETFKNSKQLLGVQQPQTHKRQGPERAAALGLWLYTMVWLWYLRQKPCDRTYVVQPWNPLKAAPSFANALASLQRALWTQRIKLMFGNSAVHDKKFQFLLEALAPAA